MKSRIFRKGLTAVGLLAAISASAQNPGAIDQFNATQQRQAAEQAAQQRHDNEEAVPEIYPGESQDMGPQSVLSLKQRRTYFEGVADSQYFYSDNPFYNHADRVPSGILVSTAQFALAPTAYQVADGEFSPRVGFRQQWYDYFQYNSQNPNFRNADFNAQTIFSDVSYFKDNWIYGAGLDYTRLMTTADYHQFYSEFTPRWVLQRVFPLSGTKTFSLGYQGYYHLTYAPDFGQPRSDFEDRLDQVLVATLTLNPVTDVIFQPYYTFRYTRYFYGETRNDYINSVGVSAYYFFNQHFSVRTFVGYEYRNSSLDAAVYHQFDAGLGLDFTVRF